MEWTVLRLQPQGAFHFGVDGIGLEASAITFASDRLYSALFVENLRSGVFPEWTADSNDIPFRISSCFPYIGDTQLFPRPLVRPSERPEQHAGERKPLKKIEFVSTEVFKHLLHGGHLRDYVPLKDHQSQGQLLQHGSIVLSRSEAQHLPNLKQGEILQAVWKVERRPHVTIDRINNQPTYYEVVQVWFNQQCGLAVLATGDIERLERLLRLLGDSGIGGRRTKGLGVFTIERGLPIDLPEPTTSHLVVLSSYLPSAAELETVLQADQTDSPLQPSYGFEHIGGWLGSLDSKVVAQRRKALRMISAGSVIRSPGTAMLGTQADLRPTYDHGDPFPHAVHRYGQALAVGIPRTDSRSSQ